jgi:CubicO group peptidase (beta-lactamase class C family)
MVEIVEPRNPIRAEAAIRRLMVSIDLSASSTIDLHRIPPSLKDWQLNKCSGTSLRENTVMNARLFGIACVSILAAFLPPNSNSAQRQDAASRERRVDDIFKSITDEHSPGIAVLIRRNGQTLLERGYGLRDLRTRAAIDSRTNFRLASCTKQFTAMAIMLLVHNRKLRYDEHLRDVFPDFPDYGRTITIRNLLTHTSGLPDYEDLMEERAAAKRGAWTETHQIQDAEVLTLLKEQKKGKFAPGTRWSYSNSGYVVLGLIVGKVSGESFPGFLHERIFAPLGMNHTLAYVNGTNEVPNRAYGHSRKNDGWVETDQSPTSATLGDGGVYSNLEDLAMWDNALAHYTLLPKAEMREALTPVKLADGSVPQWSSDSADTNPQTDKFLSYGFGWFLNPYRGKERMWHYGESIGFKTAIDRFDNGGLTAIILSNRSDVDPQPLALQAADAYLNSK